MPLLLLEPGQSVQLGPNENPADPDAVTNPNPVAGQYTTQVGDTIAIVQHFIPAHGYQPFLSPLPDGLTITNNGEVSLGVQTPGE
ncbi:MAG: hypothetical protein AAF657_11790 [Acidobacteriota bacterium]